MTHRPGFAIIAAFCVLSNVLADDHRITWRTQPLTNTYYSEGAGMGDLNKDGHADVVSGPYWYEGPDFTIKHAYYEPVVCPENSYPENFFAYVHDFNGDGWNDILRLPFPGKEAFWYENPGEKEAKGYWKRVLATPEVGNESPHWADIDGDGVNDIVCIQGGYYGYASPDKGDPYKQWTFHRISAANMGGKFTHGLGVGDVDGDGKMDLLDRRGWWQQPASLKGDPQWTFHAFNFTPAGGAQMHVYDVDGDGDGDVISSMAAHSWGLAWYEQLKDDAGGITFKQHTLMSFDGKEGTEGVKFSQLHAVDLADIDGDGLKDIITGKTYRAHHGRDPGAADPAVVYWWKLVRSENGATFSPRLIHHHSGIGRQVMAADLNGDKLLDIIVGNAMGTFVHLQQRDEAIKGARDNGKPAQGLSPKEAAAKMSVPPGFHADLLAGEPDIVQPIAMAFDERGRIWVAEAYSYPRRLPEDEARDRILIFEDKDGDGSFETRKVFHDKLNLVSGLQVGFGGVWVGAAPHLLFIPDKDRDDKPDGEPVVLLDGWGYQDTHETLNSFRWGPDGWLYGCHGVFTHSRVGKPGTPNEQRTPLNAGVWRYHPIKQDFEVFAWGTSNPWGVDFDEHGQCFITACVIPHLYHMVQGGRYQRQGGQHFNPHVYDDIKTIADHAHYAGNIRDHAHWGHTPLPPATTLAAGGGHAHAGAMIYQGDAFPDEYRGLIFMNNIHGARINTDILEPLGSGFVGRHGPDFAIANDIWSQIIAIETGPDGQVYMIDWYDKNQCHRGDPNVHDRTNGRMFRVRYAEHKPVKVDLSKQTDAQLTNLLLHKNVWYSRTARRLLQERAAQGVRPVSALRANPASSADMFTRIALDPNKEGKDRLSGLWALHVTEGVSDELAVELLGHEGDCCNYLRAWVIQLSLEDGKASEALLAKLAERAAKDHAPVVRLYLAAALQRLPHEQRWPIAEALAQRAEDLHDHNLPLLIWYGIEPLVQENKAKAAQLAAKTKIPIIRQYIARRLAGGAAPPVPQPPKPDERLGYKVKDAVEGEGLKILSITGGQARPQPMNAFTADKWSGVDHLWWTGGEVGDKLTLELPVAKAGTYELHAVLTKARDYGIVQLYLNDKKLGDPIDLFNSPDVVTTGDLNLGRHDLTAGKHKLVVEITGTNEKAVKAYMFALDYVLLKAGD